MREEYEGQGLARFAWTMVALALIGALSALGWIGWGLWEWVKP
jgi:hypothetical protein